MQGISFILSHPFIGTYHLTKSSIIYLERGFIMYSEKVIIDELMWEYDYTETQAQSIIDKYKQSNKYPDLCELIQHRLSMRLSEENMHYV